MTNAIYGSDSAVPSGLGLLLPHPTLERVGYSRASLREKGFGSVVRFDRCMAEKCPNSSPFPSEGRGKGRGVELDGANQINNSTETLLVQIP